MKYLSMALAVISTPVLAQQFTYVEVAHSSVDSDFGMNVSSNTLTGSIEVDKNIALFASYERTGGINYDDTAESLAEAFDIDASLLRSGDTTSVIMYAPARTTISVPSSGSYQDSDTTVGIRAFNQSTRFFAAYIDIKYHRANLYNSSGTGWGGRFGVRFNPIPSFSQLKLDAYGDYQITNVSNLSFDNTADNISLNFKKRSAGVELLVDAQRFTVGAAIERSQLIQDFGFKFDNYFNFNEKFTDAAHSSRLFIEYHFK